VQDSRYRPDLLLPRVSRFGTFGAQSTHVTAQREAGRASAEERKARCKLRHLLFQS
jgi:hypothetical protein